MFRIVVAAQTVDELGKKCLEIGTALSKVKQDVVRDDDPIELAEEEEILEETASVVPVEQASPVAQVVSLPPIPAAPVAQVEISGERDSKGMPWDERIHSATKATTKDGSWRYRRGVDEDTVEQVEAELKASMGQAAPAPAAPPIPPVPMASAPLPPPLPPVPPTSVVVTPPVFQQQPVAPAPVPPPSYENIPTPPPSAQKPAHTFESFRANFLMVISSLIATGKINQPYVQQLCEYFKVQNIWEVNNDDAKARELFENFCVAGMITKVG